MTYHANTEPVHQTVLVFPRVTTLLVAHLPIMHGRLTMVTLHQLQMSQSASAGEQCLARQFHKQF
jgi:hypothetical protein